MSLKEIKAERDKLRKVVEWALGYKGRFPDPPLTVSGGPKFWWRHQLRQMSGIIDIGGKPFWHEDKPTRARRKKQRKESK